MQRPGTTAVLQHQAGFGAKSQQATVLAPAILAAQPSSGFPMTIAGVPDGRYLPCAFDPDLFFAESPDEVECAKYLCRGCPARMACLTGALERREPWGVWGGELFARGEIVPRKQPRGRPRKNEVAA